MGTTMLLDAASMYFRAFYGVPETMTAPDGTPVNAVKGFLDMIARLVRARHPAQLIACMDASWRPAFRVAALPSYKAHRANPDGSEQVPDALNVQLPIIVDVLSATGIAMAWADGYEADDIIGTLAAQATAPVEVVTGDRDLFQLVDDERGIRIAYIGKGVANLELMDEAALTFKYQIPGRAATPAFPLRCAATPVTACPACRVSARRRQPPWFASSAQSRRCWQRSTPGTAASRPAAGPSWWPRGRIWTRACRLSWSPRMRPSSLLAASCRSCPPIRRGWPRWMSAGTWAPRLAVCCRRSPRRPDRRMR